jgi:hypothetical protein
MMTKSKSYHRGKFGDEMIKNFGEIEISQLLEK